MADYDPTAYGKRIADEYDALYDRVPETEEAVATLAELSKGGPVLELGIGTGRLALPLVARGVPVHGVDSSPDMVARLQAKPGGGDIPVTIDDFARVSVPEPGKFSLVVLAFNTIFALPSQQAQVACFANAARHVAPGGRFVVEGWVPDLARFRSGSAVTVRALRDDLVSLDVATLDPVNQRMNTTQVRMRDGDLRLYPANHRYAWPSELDLMGQLAGLDLEQRWGSWSKLPFTAESTRHVSVYRLPS